MSYKKTVLMDKTNRIRKTIEILKKSNKQSMLGSFSELGPWKILIATILSARAKDETTIPVSKELFRRYPDAESLAYAEKKDIEELIRKIGFYKNKTKYIIETSRIIHEDYGGSVPDRIDELLKLPGVGRKVANCELVYAFRKPAIPVDTHVHRISNRLGWVKTKTPGQTEKELLKIVPNDIWIDVNEHLVTLGREICRPIGPKHEACPISKYCEFYRNLHKQANQ